MPLNVNFSCSVIFRIGSKAKFGVEVPKINLIKKYVKKNLHFFFVKNASSINLLFENHKITWMKSTCEGDSRQILNSSPKTIKFKILKHLFFFLFFGLSKKNKKNNQHLHIQMCEELFEWDTWLKSSRNWLKSFWGDENLFDYSSLIEVSLQ